MSMIRDLERLKLLETVKDKKFKKQLEKPLKKLGITFDD